MIGGVDDEVYKTFNPFRLGMALGRMDLSGGDTGQSQCASSRLHLIHLIIEQADHTNGILAQHCLRFN